MPTDTTQPAGAAPPTAATGTPAPQAAPPVPGPPGSTATQAAATTTGTAAATAGTTAPATTAGTAGSTGNTNTTTTAGTTATTGTTSPPAPSLLSAIHWDFTAVILLLCSVIVVATIIERFLRYFKASIDAAGFMERIRNLIRNGQYPEAIKLSDTTGGPVGVVVKTAILARDRSKEETKDAIDRVRIRQGAFLERNLPILGTIGATAPFIGLFGTVLGIWRAFQQIGIAGSAGTSVVASGIAGALQATAGGLLVAIMAVVAYNFFVNWSSRIMVEVDTAGNEIVHLLAAAHSGASTR
ncbi:MAG: MotA/TolQ/ExbB proton channel family protein [Armatimonadota bacterium]|nr:MotA/TolQ/ExbB proton channel family protein [Armatimonadota bacterium]